tara:strand:- start:16 stop:420 length:405 start_codon:yes stop_codon:yes gene_type:complete
MKKYYFYFALLGTVFINNCSQKEIPVNIYDSKEYHYLTEEDILAGESIWENSCFRCHRDGTNGAASIENEEYWNHTASKGIDALFKSVWEGKQNKNGYMPPKGFCNTCSEDDIRKSVFYILHLAKQNHNIAPVN